MSRPEDNPLVIRSLTLDSLWLAGRWVGVPRAPSWNGYMQAAMQPQGATEGYHVTRVDIRPFINLSPENLSALYSALLFSVHDSCTRGQRECFVTFD